MNPHRIFFTPEERSVRRWSAQTAVDSAKVILQERHEGVVLNTASIAHFVAPSKIALNLVEVNDLSMALVSSSLKGSSLKRKNFAQK